MARTARIVLDIALESLRKLRPAISNGWDKAKVYVANTSARRLVCNPIVSKIEEKINQSTDFLVNKMISFRNKQLPKEVEYLQKELDSAKQKMQEAGCKDQGSPKDGSTGAKTLQTEGSIAWKYLKIEAVPPMTVNAFNGPLGKSLENAVGGVVNGIVNAIAGQIRSIELAEQQKIKEKEAKAKAELEKQLAEEKKIAEEKKAAAAAAAKKTAEEAKKAAEASKQKEKEKEKKPEAKKETKKTETKAEAKKPDKPAPPKQPPKAKK